MLPDSHVHTSYRKSNTGKRYSCDTDDTAVTLNNQGAIGQAFKDGDVRFLICTDVAARGIDIQGLPFVVNMTLPDRCAR